MYKALGKNNPAWRGGMVNKECQLCSKHFSVHPYRKDIARFCSRMCANKVTRGSKGKRSGKEFVCENCKSLFYREPSNIKKGITKFCSNKCWGQHMKVSFKDKTKHPRWEGGKTPLSKQIRNSKEYIDWRTTVFKRDNYTCQECGSRGYKLHADHIKPFAFYPELRLVIENGRTLCVPCHKKTDTYGHKSREYIKQHYA